MVNIVKQLRKQNLITKNGLIKCNCGRCVKIDNITYIHPLDMNYFNWWAYEMIEDNKTKLVPMKWYGYVGYVPILGSIVHYIHRLFHRRAYILIIECKYCNSDK